MAEEKTEAHWQAQSRGGPAFRVEKPVGLSDMGTSIDTQRKRIKVDGVSYTKAQAADLR